MNATLALRLLNAIPASAYEMTALLGLLRVEESRDVPTAAVTCERRPVLKLNPDFLAARCASDESLFMLVMHELHHVLLGHTRLFPRVTPLHNLAFDAVINALLSTRFPAPAHTALFLDCYGGQEGALRLLAPPAGDPVKDPDLRRLHETLYSASADVTCLEVFERLVAALGSAGLPSGLGLLLGNHGAEGSDDYGTAGPLPEEVVTAIRDIVEKWPPPPEAIRGRSLADLLETRDAPPASPGERVLAAVRRALDDAAARGRRPGATRSPGPAPALVPIPSPRDRRAVVARLAGAPPLLYAGEVECPKARASGRALVYLDVSGSMNAYLPFLSGALVRLRDRIDPRLRVFSTQSRHRPHRRPRPRARADDGRHRRSLRLRARPRRRGAEAPRRHRRLRRAAEGGARRQGPQGPARRPRPPHAQRLPARPRGRRVPSRLPSRHPRPEEAPMTNPLKSHGRRFAEAVCAGHPDRLADSIADGIVALATARDPEALVGVEVALHRSVVFVDGRIAAGFGAECAVTEAELEGVVREAYARAGYDDTFEPAPPRVEVRFDLCLGPLEPEERAFRRVADDQVIGVGYACAGERAGLVPLEQGLARDFAKAIEGLRTGRRKTWIGPDGKVLVVVRGRRLEAVSLSLHHGASADWLKLCALAKRACLGVASEYVAAGELDPPRADWLFNGAGTFSIGGPLGDNGLSGKKLVAEAYGTAVPIGGGTIHGKDPLKPDVRAQRIARERAVERVREGSFEATVWVVFRPGDEEPAWVEERVLPVRQVIA